MTASAIYAGVVRHRRYAVRGHELRHGLALAYIDLDEIPFLLGGRLLARGPGVARFRREDYLGDSTRPLAETVRETVAEQTGRRPRGPIRLLSHLRTFGHSFNPVSFYYCMDPSGEHVECVLAEVTNTPWGERYAYVLDPTGPSTSQLRVLDPRPGHPRVLGGSVAKALHVSPFMAMDQRYEWRLTEPGRTLSVHIASYSADELTFDATLALRRRELTRASLARVTAHYPLATLRVLALIYAHGFALRSKGVPIHRHPQTT